MKKILSLLAPAIMTLGFYKVNPARNTVDAAVGQLNVALDGLRKVKQQQDAEAVKQEAAKVAAEAAAAAALKEAERAARIIAKVEDLLA